MPITDNNAQPGAVIGRLPERTDTVCAAVLAALLEGKVLTGMDSVIQHCTTRLSAVINELEKRHGWVILRERLQVTTSDGRTPTIAGYHLCASAIALAATQGADPWTAQVKTDWSMRRKKAKASRPASRKPPTLCFDPRQLRLWE
jgi:hypothetical protein